MNARAIYYTFLAIFILRVAFSALPYDSDLIHWWVLYIGQTSTFQWAFWRFNILLVELFLITIIVSAALTTNEKDRFSIARMAKIMFVIQLWYIFEYCVHYTSVWVTWEQLGLSGNGRSGISSHVVTCCIFAWLGDD